MSDKLSPMMLDILRIGNGIGEFSPDRIQLRSCRALVRRGLMATSPRELFSGWTKYTTTEAGRDAMSEAVKASRA